VVVNILDFNLEKKVMGKDEIEIVFLHLFETTLRSILK